MYKRQGLLEGKPFQGGTAKNQAVQLGSGRMIPGFEEGILGHKAGEMCIRDSSDGFWRRQILITVKDRDPARVDNPFLIEELSEERPGILLWMLEGLHRLLANCYQFTISERSIQNLEAAMADSDNLTQFMQASAYVLSLIHICRKLVRGLNWMKYCVSKDSSTCAAI